jgi:hypothetical protein
MAIVFVVAAICSNAIYGPLLSSFSAVPSVQQYCTSKYPVAAVTATFTATPVTTAVTSIELFPALTVTETVGSIETMIGMGAEIIPLVALKGANDFPQQHRPPPSPTSLS